MVSIEIAADVRLPWQVALRGRHRFIQDAVRRGIIRYRWRVEDDPQLDPAQGLNARRYRGSGWPLPRASSCRGSVSASPR